MSEPLLNRLLLPVADESDAEATCEVVKPYIEAGGTELFVLHVLEPSDETSDNPPPETNAIFETIREAFAGETVSVSTETRVGNDVVGEIARVAADVDATAIAVLPRPKSLFSRLLPKKESVADLVSRTDVPVVVFPQDGAESGSARLTLDAETGEWTPTLLVPFGESDRPLEAVAFAASAYSSPRIIGLHVFTASDTDVYSEITPGVSSELDDADTERKRRVKTVFRKAVDRADRDGIEMETVIAPGDVLKAISHYVREESVDMLVVGLAESDRPDERALGKLSTSLVRNAPVPVVLA
jgi:nucleotide-binding universal stress UspA family protein